MKNNPMFTSEWRTVADIKRITGHDRDTIHRAVRAAIAARIVTGRLIGKDMVPAFKVK